MDIALPPYSTYCGDASWLCPSVFYDPVYNPAGLRPASPFQCAIFYNPCTECLQMGGQLEFPVLYIFQPEQQVQCPQCAIPAVVSSSAAATANVNVNVNLPSGADGSSGANGGDAYSQQPVASSPPTTSSLYEGDDGDNNSTLPSEVPGLVGAYAYDPTNKTTAVLYNTSTPVEPPTLDDVISDDGNSTDLGSDNSTSGDDGYYVGYNGQQPFFYGNTSQEIYSTNGCPNWCYTSVNSTTWDSIPPCQACSDDDE